VSHSTSAGGDPPRIGGTVRALGAVSFLADVSSEMVYAANPALLTRVLGAAPWAVGVIEGIAESTASLLRLYAGWLSDRIGRRKPLTLAGYGLGAVSKPLIGLATGWGGVLVGRFLDRAGKGLRSAPRDALIAESCSPEVRGRAFGLHRGMDTAGAVLGPLIGYAFLSWRPGALRDLYLLAFAPGALAVAVLAIWVRERRRPDKITAPSPPLPSFRGLSSAYRRYLIALAVFSIGNSSDAFLVLRAQDVLSSGVGGAPGDGAVRMSLLLYAAFNVVEAVLGYPAGALSDRVGRRPLLIAGLMVFSLVYLGFALASSPWHVWGLFLLYGAYYTMTGGTQRAYAADLADPERRATDLGAYHFVVGALALPASLIAGFLYGRHAAAPFALGAICAGLTAAMLAWTVGADRRS